MNCTKKEKLRKFKIGLLVIVLVFVICCPLFIYFRLSTEGRLALREAKNVKLKLQVLDIEAYGNGSSVFDSSRKNGMKKGSIEKIRDFLEMDCDVNVTSYDAKNRIVTGFVYQRGRYQVIYFYDDEKGDTWKVNYIFEILRYDGD